ncbi:hypothetical protein MKX01_030071 [Papaver californicum]|nr:hypothetical protein MKX01_030071 [Papaver californicum]
MLLMVQAYTANVICPNKHQAELEKFHNNQLLESETYIGGHVECLESGVFRSDLPTKFQLDPAAYEQLIHNLDRDLQYAIKVEGKMDLDSVSNYGEVKNAILEKLEMLRDEPIREEPPLIYHLDVAAMYPNIILTNRLQPPSIVSDEICTACDFNRPGKTCLRTLEWVWRGETFTAKKSDYYHLKRQIESELVDNVRGQIAKSFLDLPKTDQQVKLKDRLKKYCQKAYKRVLDKPVTEVREAGICMRENPFYVDTVRSFRDRRYEYKGLNKDWKGKLGDAKASGNSIKIQEAQDMVVLYDSLQLAHKCILNSFYGYVMRKGARWYSMEMAGVVTYTGAKIIQNARVLVEKIGRPLELDTDGIWCALPGSFPENFTFKTKDLKKKLTISYPCVMLNVDVARNNTNDQYQTLEDPINKTYTTQSECSIEFEVDGPYKAMILPASKEEGILIKKRYAVFNDDGTIAELKGFEIKRRVELKLIKLFQAEVFDKFLDGQTLEQCYSAVAAVANRWLDLLDNQGIDVADSELLDYISESSTMSKSLADYGEQKSCAVTTARRLADFLGDTMVKDKGLRCQYIVACEPQGSSVSERAIPVAIFETGAEIMKYYVRRWCKISSVEDFRSIVDWSYYKQRLGSTIQKIITIPAAMQKVANPVPRVIHPDWLHKRVREKDDKFRQRKLVDMFSPVIKGHNGQTATNHVEKEAGIEDLEDFGNKSIASEIGPRPIVRSYEVNKEGQPAKQLSPRLSLQQPTTITYENIDRNVDYQAWLAVKKRKWKDTREEKNRLKRFCQSDGISELPAAIHTRKKGLGQNGVSSFLKRNELSLARTYWQVVTEEDQFKLERRKLAAHLADPEVEGIYETKVPLEFNAILQIGCVCKVDKSAKNRNSQEGWKLAELQMKTTTECSYLDQSIGYFYLYHSISEARAIYATYFPASSTIIVVVVNPFQNKELTTSILEKQFREACQALSVEPSLSGKRCTCKVEYVGHAKDAESLLQRAIIDYRHEHHGPAIGVIECPDVHSVRSGIRVLDDFPCVSIPCNARDSNYQVPLGNFELDWLLFTADTFLSRALRDQQQLLWISDDGIPDLGGINEDDTCFADEVSHPVLTYPGAYRKVSVELKVHHLAVNALLKSNQINEMEGGALFGFDLDISGAHEQTGLGEASACASAFRVLKQLIQRCIQDAIKFGNVYADALLQHLYRWFCSPQSKLHDPALHRVLHKVMEKVFALLLAEFRKLGAKIIFADFSKIIIDTGKSDLSAAQAYCDCLLKTLQTRDLFEWVELEPLHFFYSLLFMDQYNYGGIQAKADGASSSDVSRTLDDCIADDPQIDIVSNWNISEYLPKVTQDHFILIVSEFLYKPWKYSQEQAAVRASSVDGSLCTPSITGAAAESFEIQLTAFLKEQVSSFFTAKLLKIVRDITQHFKTNKSQNDRQKSHELPHVAGSSSHTGDAALEFIKHVCAVLALDRSVQHNALVLRRNLLKFVRVKEFDPVAEFRNPCVSFTLPNVICSYCNDCRDLDLCRDSALLADEWRCAVPQCGQPYNREVVENALLQVVRQRERLYHIQDLVCLKCNQVKAAHLAEQCKCAGAFKCKEDASEYHSKMQVFLNIAVRQNFQLLQESISWILEVQ